MQKLILIFAIVTLGLFSACSAQPALQQSEGLTSEAYTKRQKEVQTIIHTAENYICNPSWIETEAWKNFKATIQSEEMMQLPLKEFVRTFNMEKKKLPFTHIYLVPTVKENTETTAEKKDHFELNRINEQTALLTIRSFVADAPGMIQLVQQIQSGDYSNLIIDLRGNTGGTLDAAVVLGRFLTNQAIDAGVYLSRKWFLENGDYPTQEEIQAMPFLQDMSFDGFGKMLDENGAFRMVLPPHSNPTFQGKVYVLTDGITGSTCEPLVDRLKKSGIATIVGERTGGGMLSARYFKISDDLKMFLPVADYITADGTRIDKVGVEPDVKVPAEKALDYVLNSIQ
jgi:hypothetical protein